MNACLQYTIYKLLRSAKAHSLRFISGGREDMKTRRCVCIRYAHTQPILWDMKWKLLSAQNDVMPSFENLPQHTEKRFLQSGTIERPHQTLKSSSPTH